MERDRSGGGGLINWLETPLDLLCQIDALDLMITTRRYMLQKDAHYSDLTKLQRDLIRWIDNG